VLFDAATTALERQGGVIYVFAAQENLLAFSRGLLPTKRKT